MITIPLPVLGYGLVMRDLNPFVSLGFRVSYTQATHAAAFWEWDFRMVCIAPRFCASLTKLNSKWRTAF